MPVLGISQDDAEWTREFKAEFGITFPVVLDSEERGYPVSNAFGIASVPSLFVVRPEGSIAWTGAGFSRLAMEELGRMAGAPLVRPGEKVPEWKSG